MLSNDIVDTEVVPVDARSELLGLTTTVVLLSNVVGTEVVPAEEGTEVLELIITMMLLSVVGTEVVPVETGSELLELTTTVVLLSNVVDAEVVPLESGSELLELIATVVLGVKTVVSIGVDETSEVDGTCVLLSIVVVTKVVLLRSSADTEDATVAETIAEEVLANVEFTTGNVVDSRETEDGDVTRVMPELELTEVVTIGGVGPMLVPFAAEVDVRTECVGRLVALIVAEDATVVRTTRLLVKETKVEVVREPLTVAEIEAVV